MINKEDNPVEFALWMYELEDAVEHLQGLIKEVVNASEYDEPELRVDLGHVYSHLNRAWNSRNYVGDMPSEKWQQYSEFPKDLDWT